MDGLMGPECKQVTDTLVGAAQAFVSVPFQWDNSFAVASLLCTAVTIGCWLLYYVTDNLSHVDRWWSLGPTTYSLIFAWRDLAALAAGDLDAVSPRMLVMAFLTTAWGTRLTYNFWRRDGYSSIFGRQAEDYRWVHVRKLPWLQNRLVFEVFHLVFVAIWQNLLLFSIALPAYVASVFGRGQPLGALDLAGAALFTLFLCLEATADQQQYVFQTEKHRRIGAGEPLTGMYADGFLSSGLWALSRHPNYFSEQAIWWSFCLFAVSTTGCWVNPCWLGAAALSALFLGSIWITEKVTASKYHAYRRYQRAVSSQVFWLPGYVPKKQE